jgi:hypothetical protein
MRLKSLLPALALLVTLAACASFTDKTNELTIGMSADQVKSVLGDEYTKKMSQLSSDGKPIELWEYVDQKSNEKYWLYFKDSRLAKWGTPQALQESGDLYLPGERGDAGAAKPVPAN